MSLVLKDRLDREFPLKCEDGEKIHDILVKNHIPLDAIFLHCNGEVIDDYSAVYYSKNSYVIEMVRAYHLPDFLTYLNLWENKPTEVFREGESFYTKRLAIHDKRNGDFQYIRTSYSKDELVTYLDNMFVSGVYEAGLIEDGDDILLAISGGRDSLSLAYFLTRNKDRLPKFNLTAVHVETSSNKLETTYCMDIAKRFNIPLTVISEKETTELYNLNVSIYDAMDSIKDDFNRSYAIFSAHNIIRANVEKFAREHKKNKIIYGLMKEDVAASIIKGTFIGRPFTGPLVREYGDFTLIYPLWPIAKKELTLYLEVVDRKNNQQGSPMVYERGALSRDVYYMMIDTIEDIYPGACYQLFEAQKIANTNYIKKIKYCRCNNCGTTYTDSYRSDERPTVERKVGFCDLCNMFNQFGYIKG